MFERGIYMAKKKNFLFNSRFKIIIAALILIILIIGVFSCSMSDGEHNGSGAANDVPSSADADAGSSDDSQNAENAENSDDANDSNTTSENDTKTDSSIYGAVPGEKKGTVRVGAENYGFIDVPDTWVTFTDEKAASLSGLSVKQYSDASGKNIITLNCSESQTDPKSAASSCWNQMEQEGASDIHGATVTLDGCETYQVYGYYADEDIVLVIWIFFDDDGMLHYISAEGPADSISSTVKIIEKTFSLE